MAKGTVNTPPPKQSLASNVLMSDGKDVETKMKEVEDNLTKTEKDLSKKLDETSKTLSDHSHSANKITAGVLPAGVVATNANDLGTSRIRNIYAGTTDIGVGASLPAGSIYLVYE